MIVAEASYEVTDPTVDSQIVHAAGLGRRHVRQHHDAEVRGAGDPQGLRHRLEAAALPEQRLASIGSVLTPAGLDKSVGLITAAYYQGSDRPAVEGRPGDARVARVHEEATTATAT